MRGRRLLIIDDLPEIGAFLCGVAEQCGFEAAAVDNASEFWNRYGAMDPEVIFLDLKMPRSDGIELLRELAWRKCKAKIVIMSGMDHRVLRASLRLGSDLGLSTFATLTKPFSAGNVKELFGKILASEWPLGEADLHQAMEAGQIVVYYQPQATLWHDRPYTITACEALARWNHPQRGLLGPREFIPLAESTKLIEPLTELVFRQAVEQLVTWQGQGLMLSVAINFSPHLLRRLDIPDMYDSICQLNGVETGRVTVELTESGVMSDPTLAADIMTRFRLKGFGLSLDDIGTGYSSLVQLYRLPFNEMKIDTSFVIDSDRDLEAEKIIRSIAGLARDLDVRLCAEGVQSPKALALARYVGCHAAQGYLIGKPMPAEDLSALIRSRSDMTDADEQPGGHGALSRDRW